MAEKEKIWRNLRSDLYFRWRVIIFGVFALFAAATIIFITYGRDWNRLGAHVETYSFSSLRIQNRSGFTWHDVVITVNDDFIHWVHQVTPTQGDGLVLDFDDFTYWKYKPLPLPSAEPFLEYRSKAPSVSAPRFLNIRCQEGAFELLL